MNECVIKTLHLKKEYGNKLAIDDFNIDVSSNNIIGLIGKNGSGKTTLMKLLAGQLDATSGEVKVFSENPMNNLKVLQDLVYIYHNYNYPKALNLETIISYYDNMFSSFDKNFARELIQYFDLKLTMKYHQLSQGMASIFNFICGLSCRAKLTMFDEPVLGMDVSVRKSVYEILLRDYTEYPRNIIISSHLISEIEGVLSEIILIDQGKLIVHDSLDTLRESAYRLNGAKDEIEQFIKDKDVLYLKSGDVNSFAVVRGKLNDRIVAESKSKHLEISSVRMEDLFVYLTNTKQGKEEELECLWEKAK